MKRIDSYMMENLLIAAKSSNRQRKHHSFHQSLEDPCHRLVVAMTTDSYIQPHRHLAFPKDELFVILHGIVAVFIFSETGAVRMIERIEAGGTAVGVEIPAGAWHTLVAIQDSVLLEVKSGPYMPIPAEDLASWAYFEDNPQAPSYLNQLRIEACR